MKVSLSDKEVEKYFKENYQRKQKNSFSLDTRRFFRASMPYFIIAGVVTLGGIIAMDILTPNKPVQFTWNGILMFLSICAGIGWVLHGTGFLLVKVN